MLDEFSLSMEALTAGYLPINRLYDMVGLVDPIRKTVVSIIHPPNNKQVSGMACCTLWNQGKLCDDCIAIKACNNGRNFIKIKHNGEKSYWVTAVPVSINGKPLVLEMVKNISEHLFLDIRDNEKDTVYQISGDMNDLISHDLLTGAFNKPYIFEHLSHEIQASVNHSLLVIYACIDNLDQYRSVNGFQAGEILIKKFAQLLGQYCQTDNKIWLARWEEAEFLISMPDILESEAAYRLAGQIKLGIKKARLSTVQTSVSLHKIDSQNQLFRQDLWDYLNGPPVCDNSELPGQLATPLLQNCFINMRLSKREIEVARLLLQGRTNYDIAQVIFVGIPTVKKHLSSIYKKAGVNSRLEFLAKCQRLLNK